jgi:hypothetical protein
MWNHLGSGSSVRSKIVLALSDVCLRQPWPLESPRAAMIEGWHRPHCGHTNPLGQSHDRAAASHVASVPKASNERRQAQPPFRIWIGLRDMRSALSHETEQGLSMDFGGPASEAG